MWELMHVILIRILKHNLIRGTTRHVDVERQLQTICILYNITKKLCRLIYQK